MADRMTRQRTLGLTDDRPDAIHESILDGFPFSAWEQFEQESQLPESMMQQVVRIPDRTLVRRRQSGRLTAEESERLYRLADLYEKTVDLFNGDITAANDWLSTARPALGDRTPLELAQTEVGARRVETLIGQLRYGVVA